MHLRTAVLALAPALAVAAAAAAADKTPVPAAAPQTRPGSVVTAKPDLVVTIDSSGTGFPNSFTVRNAGSVDSKLSVLKVTATFVPPDGPITGGGGGSANCPPTMSQAACDAAAALVSLLSGLTGGAPVDTTAACGEPFKEIVEAVPVLKPGESKTFTRPPAPSSVLVGGVFKPSGASQGTYVKKCAPTLVCAFDVVAKADASNDNDELNKANNTATRRAYREIRFQ